MKSRLSKKRNQAMDIMDLLVLIAIIAILAVMVILSLKKMHSRAHSAFGPDSLKQARLSYHIIEYDDDTRYPMAVSAAAQPEFKNGTITINSPSRFP